MTPFREVLAALWVAVRSVRVSLLLWVVFTAIALPVAWTASHSVGMDGARWNSPVVLPADADVFSHLQLDLAGPLVLAFVLGILFAGCILATVGTDGPRVALRDFLARGARAFLANFRVILLFTLGAVLLSWGLDALDARIRSSLETVSPGATLDLIGVHVRFVHLLLLWDLARGLLFLALLLTCKIAMATVTGGRRRSAFVAGLTAVATVLRHPYRVAVAVLTWALIWIGGSLAFGELTVRMLEVRADLVLGAVAGEAGVLFAIVGWVGFTLSARRIAEA
ncbi:MAG: hypothetical protein U1F36_19155 [Planctomycetota bacterium]